MADSLAEQVVNLLRRFGKQFNRKASEVLMILINHKNAGSLGALAGFAIAVAFTWKFLRSPSRSQRNQRKRLGSSSSNADSTQAHDAAFSSERHPAFVDFKDESSIDGSISPAELTLGQIVRKKLNGGRKMTCQLLGVVFEERTPEELQKHATVRPPVVEVFLEITKNCDVYLMETVLDDESEERALKALEDAGVFRAGGLIKDKVLFCSTETGRTSFVRQLEPDWHVDTSLDIVSQLSRFIGCQLFISPIGSDRMASNVFGSTSLEQFFSEGKP
ncbi:peroxisome biogenesis protein 22-like [Aristolochia californica]|uniref:peroxisome biogenesis protein 22-like n=1 Tax=Aristolochia californica TaxID=171875 RepID=UPI0035D9221D